MNDENKATTENSESVSNEQKEIQSRYVFECQKCGECCEKKDSVVVSITDLERWNKDLTLPSLYPYLAIEMMDNASIQISLKKNESSEGEKQTGCPLYDENNKICNIYFSMPLFCRSFPLGYDRSNFYIKDKTCSGLGKGDMTEEALKEARDCAREDFEVRVSSSMLLPIIHGLILGFIMDQSKKQIDSLTPEQKNKLTEIFGKDKGENKGK